MNRSTILQIISAAILVALATVLVNPFDLWMSSMMHVAALGGAVAAFGAFTLFALAERGGDERDERHRFAAGRAAFLAGGAVLLLAIVLQSARHQLDSWLVLALVTMVLAKVLVRLYAALYR